MREVFLGRILTLTLSPPIRSGFAKATPDPMGAEREQRWDGSRTYLRKSYGGQARILLTMRMRMRMISWCPFEDEDDPLCPY